MSINFNFASMMSGAIGTNDGITTKNEDANGDGDPRNDFSDPNNPNLPDYLNPAIK